ncbi:MAG: sensor histidine kinase [Alphaproteobacteria bacterium]|nr:sensor histidine kinase [Alphaproteobacteria bacterium]
MRLHVRLLLMVGLATMLPLGITGYAAGRIARNSHISQARVLHGKQAEALAVFTATWLNDRLRGLRLATSVWDVERLGSDELEGFQRLLYRQYDAVNVVVTVDADGQILAGPLAIRDPAQLVGPLAAHEAVDEDRQARFIANLPYTQALVEGAALGTPYEPAEGRAPVVPAAVATSTADGVVGVELSLSQIAGHFASQVVPEGAVALLDSSGAVISGAGTELVDAAVHRNFRGRVAGDAEYLLGDRHIFAAFHSVADTGWTVVIAVPADRITAAGKEIERRTLFMYGLAAVLVAAMGLVGARQISRPVVKLKDAAVEVGRGDLGRTVDPEGNDEVTELTRAFNEMSQRLRENQDTIAAKNQEIEAWNEELLERVEARTRELQESQKRLVRTARMAAVAEMGAGLAHELNNPVAGILGMAQIARVKATDPRLIPMITAIEEQAQRCRAILQSLGRFSSAGGVEERQPIELNALLEEILGLIGGSYRDAGLRIEHDRSVALNTVGSPALLGQALAQLLRSLRAALGPGGALHISGEQDGDEVRLRLALSGAARAGGDDWLASGMGFWIAQQVFREHGGRLEEPPDPSAASPVYTVTLPAG